MSRMDVWGGQMSEKEYVKVTSTWTVCFDCCKSSRVSAPCTVSSCRSSTSFISTCLIKSCNKLWHLCGATWLGLQHHRKKINNTLKATTLTVALKWRQLKVMVKAKGHTLDIAALSEETSLQKHSGMARVVDGFHSFTCKPTRLFMNGMNHTCLCLPSRS